MLLALTIAFELDAPAVKRLAVHPEHEPVLGPVEVDLISGDPGVRPRLGEPRARDQRQHPSLGARAGGCGLGLGFPQVPENVGSSAPGVSGR
jgi:hypothetical protein